MLSLLHLRLNVSVDPRLSIPGVQVRPRRGRRERNRAHRAATQQTPHISGSLPMYVGPQQHGQELIDPMEFELEVEEFCDILEDACVKECLEDRARASIALQAPGRLRAWLMARHARNPALPEALCAAIAAGAPRCFGSPPQSAGVAGRFGGEWAGQPLGSPPPPLESSTCR